MGEWDGGEWGNLKQGVSGKGTIASGLHLVENCLDAIERLIPRRPLLSRYGHRLLCRPCAALSRFFPSHRPHFDRDRVPLDDAHVRGVSHNFPTRWSCGWEKPSCRFVLKNEVLFKETIVAVRFLFSFVLVRFKGHYLGKIVEGEGTVWNTVNAR